MQWTCEFQEVHILCTVDTAGLVIVFLQCIVDAYKFWALCGCTVLFINCSLSQISNHWWNVMNINVLFQKTNQDHVVCVLHKLVLKVRARIWAFTFFLRMCFICLRMTHSASKQILLFGYWFLTGHVVSSNEWCSFILLKMSRSPSAFQLIIANKSAVSSQFPICSSFKILLFFLKYSPNHIFLLKADTEMSMTQKTLLARKFAP